MYIMYTDSFLPKILDISISYDLVLSDHFPLLFEFAHKSVAQFKYFLRQPPLRFNSSFLDHEVFHGYMCQLIEKFNLHVQDVGFEVCDVFVVNVQKLSRFYGMYNAFKRRRKIKALATLLGRCNALLSFWPMDEQLLDIHKILSTSLCDMNVKCYQQARLHKLRQEVDDCNCQSHNFFHALHESHERYNVVRLQENGRMIMDPHMIVTKCVDYYKQLLDVETHVDEIVNYAERCS